MSTTSLDANLTILPEPTHVYTYWSDLDTQFQLSWDVQPSTAYTVTIGKNMEGKYGQKLGKDTTIRFTTREAESEHLPDRPGPRGDLQHLYDHDGLRELPQCLAAQLSAVLAGQAETSWI